jgi:iron complex outermembrane recepter protein
MNSRRLLARYAIGLLIVGIVPLSIGRSAQAQSASRVEAIERTSNSPAQTVTKWLSQSPTVRVTGVKVNQTTTGVEVILETPQTATLEPTATTTGNTTTSTVPNAVLALPDGKEYRVENPVAGITSVMVTQSNANTIRVSVTGATAVPTVQVVAGSPTAPTTAQAPTEPELEVVVTGTRKQGYSVPNASVGTKTGEAIRDVPQSIQVVPRQVIEDQGQTSFNDTLRNVSGVSQAQGGRIDIRGFRASENILRNGVRNDRGGGITNSSNLDLEDVEQIEILKGPASVLYGGGEPGGSINITTKQPSKYPKYKVQTTVGNFSFFRPSIDLTGPLTEDKRITYRFNGFYENSGSFVDFVKSENFGLFPVVRAELGKDTTLTFDGTYRKESGILRPRLPAIGTVLPNPSGNLRRSLFTGEPSFDRRNFDEVGIGYRLEHKFSDDWSVKNSFSFNSLADRFQSAAFDSVSEDGRTANRTFQEQRDKKENYNFQADVSGKVKTGSIEHSLLVGAEFNRGVGSFRNPTFGEFGAAAPLDLFAPVYGDLSGLAPLVPRFDEDSTGTSYGVYAQNLVSITKNLKVLVGGRYDITSQDRRDNTTGELLGNDPVGAFSPRVGVVYQPIEPISLYTSYSGSFTPSFGRDRLGSLLKPVTGQQFEVGVKGEFFDRKASATLAVFDITRRNDLVPDPVDPDNFEIQLGAVRSRGIELDLTGEPTPGLKLIANYAITDAKIAEDTRPEFVGERTINVPSNSGSLWAVYAPTEGNLKGWGFGTGLSYVGERVGNFPGAQLGERYNLDPYLRVDALLYYRRDNWKAQLNVENLLGTNYIESSFGGDVLVGRPFTVKAQVGVTF